MARKIDDRVGFRQESKSDVVLGIGWVGVRNGNHAGPATLYVRMSLARDQIGLCAAVGSANHVAPWGGMDLLLGTMEEGINA